MGYNKTHIEQESITAIKENGLVFISEIFAYVPFSSATFYNHGLEKLESIKKVLDDNKIKTCQSLKKKWFDSDNPTLQIALFKTICSDDNLRKLSQTYHDLSTDGEPLKFEVNWGKNEKGKD